MIWIFVIVGFLIAALLYHAMYTQLKTPLSPNPTIYAQILSQVYQARLTMNYGFFVNGKYFLKYAYLYVYVKERSQSSCNPEKRFVREMIWSFKEGKYDVELLYRLSQLVHKVLDSPYDSTILICIPASNARRHEQRFKKFSEDICKLAGLQNGYEYVKVVSERSQSHLSDSREEPDWKNLIDINEKKMVKKSVILFDDVLTSGKTYGSLKKYLEDKGIKVRCGVFLATVPANEWLAC